MDLSFISVKNASFWSSGEKEGISSPRIVTQYELECFKEPKGISFIDGVSYPLVKNSFIFVSPGQVRCSSMPYSAEFLYFTLECDENDKIYELISHIPPISEPSGTSAELMHRIIALYGEVNELSTLRLKALLTELLFRLPEPQKKVVHTNDSYRKEVLSSVVYMKSHLGDRLTVEKVASAVGYSAPHFASFFRKSVGITPMRYLSLLRLQEAKRLLTSSDCQLSEIAASLGYCHESHFIASFKRATGETPAVYRSSPPDEYDLL